MKFEELFNTLMEDCYKKHGKRLEEDNHDDDGDGVPNWVDKKPGEDDNKDKKKQAKSKKGKMPAGLAAYHDKKKKK
jgi:hypothetical protein